MTNRSESTRSRAQDAGAGQVRDGVRRRERRIARSQVWDSARGSGVATPDPHPSAPSAGPVYLNSWPLGNPLGYSRSQIPRFPMMVDMVMDRGYTDYAWFGQLTAQAVWFVTRLKDPAVYEVVETRRIPTQGRVERGEIIRLTGVGAAEECPHLLRRGEDYHPEKDTTLVFLTNHLAFGTTTIAAIYQ